MVRLTYTFSGDMFADGDGADQHLMDLSEKMSGHYGRLIRQGQIFNVKKIEARMVNLDPFVEQEDEVIAVSGAYIFMEPTSNRKAAWREAFKTVQANRKLLGLQGRRKSYDFRVGLAPGYNTDVGVGNDGVKFNAWVADQDEPLHLAGHGTQGIFDVYNTGLPGDPQPQDDNEVGFDTWIQKELSSIGEDVDFVTNEEVAILGTTRGYYIEGAASTEFERAPFMLSFQSRYGPGGPDNGAVTNPSQAEDIQCMCGVIGVFIDTTTVDDSIFQGQDYSMEITVDVESWSPIGSSSRRSR